MFKESQNRPPSWTEVYGNAMALYSLLKTSNTIRVRRADMKSGELQAEPIDFVCDIEIKAKRELQADPMGLAEWQLVLEDPDNYELLPEDLRLRLGFTFGVNLLGVDGDYRRLYWRAKQEQDRRAVMPKEEDDGGSDFAIFGGGEQRSDCDSERYGGTGVGFGYDFTAAGEETSHSS